MGVKGLVYVKMRREILAIAVLTRLASSGRVSWLKELHLKLKHASLKRIIVS